MEPVNAAVLTGTVVTAGTWAAGKPLTIRTVVGATVVAVGLAAMNDSAPQLANRFGVLILVVALFMYAPAVLWKAGLISHKRYPKPPIWGGAVK